MSVTDTIRRRLDPVMRRYWPVVVATVVSALAVTVSVAAQASDEVSTPVGHVVQASNYDLDKLTTDTIQLPSGPVEVGVGKPVTDTSGHELSNTRLAGREAPDDGSFVPVSTDPGVDSDQPSTAEPELVSRVPVSVELVADGRRYPVPANPTIATDTFSPAVARDAWVAVAGHPKTISVAITFDGVRQVVTPSTGKRTAGLAAPLYAGAQNRDRTQQSCGSAVVSRGFATRDPVECDADVDPALPYLPQFGWAPAGSRWLAVQVAPGNLAVFTSPATPDVEYYAFRNPVVRVTVDGLAASGTGLRAPTLLRSSSIDPSWLAVFRVPADGADRRLTIAATWPKTNTDARDGERSLASPDVTVTWTRTI